MRSDGSTQQERRIWPRSFSSVAPKRAWGYDWAQFPRLLTEELKCREDPEVFDLFMIQGDIKLKVQLLMCCRLPRLEKQDSRPKQQGAGLSGASLNPELCPPPPSLSLVPRRNLGTMLDLTTCQIRKFVSRSTVSDSMRQPLSDLMV